MITRAAALLPAFLAPLALAAQEFAIDPALVEDCTRDRAPACIAAAAQACMTISDGGSTTVGMGRCLDLSLSAWDARLNRSYAALMAQHRADDAQRADWGSSAPELATPLREMQRAWIAYRDAACTHEAVTWGGGTGGGPAFLGCLVELTGQQTLRLERYLREGEGE